MGEGAGWGERPVRPGRPAHPVRGGIGGVVIGLLAFGALGIGAVSATHSQAGLVSARAIREADASNRYYACLTAEAHRLVRPDDVVFLGEANLFRWVTVIKTMSGWAHWTMHLSHATVAIVVVHTTHGPTCAGEILVSIRRLAHGKVLIRSGARGAS